MIKTDIEGHIIIAGDFKGTFSFDNNSIHTDNVGAFILELDTDGNFVSLNRIVESFFYIQYIIFDVNNEGSICLSFKSAGSAFVNGDTIGTSGNLLLYLDQDKNVLWHNNKFNTSSKNITHIQFNSSSQILVLGKDNVEETYSQVVFKYNEIGVATDSAFISGSGGFGLSKTISPTANNRVLVTGSYQDFTIIEDDTLFAFDRYANSYIYTLSDNLEFVKSSQISGTRPICIIENQHNSYFVGSTNQSNYPVVFANDTIFQNENDIYFIAKLNSIITPVLEKDAYNKVFVYPNPSSGILNVVLPEEAPKSGFFEIFSITGQKVYKSIFSEKSNTVDLSNLDKGIYFIQFNLEGEIYSQKIIIQ